jgi:hypothetical protein
VARGEEDAAAPLGGLAEFGRRAVQSADGQFRVDGVLAAAVVGVVDDAAAFGHHRQDVLLVRPAFAEFETEPVVPVAVGEAAVVGEVVLAGGRHVTGDTGVDEVVDQSGSGGCVGGREYRHGRHCPPWRADAYPPPVRRGEVERGSRR